MWYNEDCLVPGAFDVVCLCAKFSNSFPNTVVHESFVLKSLALACFSMNTKFSQNGTAYCVGLINTLKQIDKIVFYHKMMVYVLSSCATQMSHTQVHHFYAWTHLQIPINIINISLVRTYVRIHEILVHWWDGIWNVCDHQFFWVMQIWLIYCIYCTILVFTVKPLIKTINMSSISFHLPS